MHGNLNSAEPLFQDCCGDTLICINTATDEPAEHCRYSDAKEPAFGSGNLTRASMAMAPAGTPLKRKLHTLTKSPQMHR